VSMIFYKSVNDGIILSMIFCESINNITVRHVVIFWREFVHADNLFRLVVGVQLYSLHNDTKSSYR